MRIKRLEILGFKSFTDKASLDFQQPVTAVVGPNGCGKSNIVDAFRWVMGEQSAKNLRGKSMEDVIFGGSETRKPVGMAEVTVTFSTEDGRVPVKYLNFSEIQVTRRLYRDGDSDYLINKSPCRLMDVHELFMDTGAGARAYSMIEQGRIGLILHAKPEERRFLIEEAAGITKYKSRKKEALKRLDDARHNLLRISDIIGEVKRQLNALQRQVKKAEKYREYRDEAREIELLFATAAHADLRNAHNAAEVSVTANDKRLEELALALVQIEGALAAGKIAVHEEEQGVSRSQEEIFRIKGELQVCENRLELSRRERDNLDRRKIRRAEEMTAFRQQLQEAETELAQLAEQRGAMTVALGEAEETLAAKSAIQGEIIASEQEMVRQVELGRRELFSLAGEISLANNHAATIVKRLQTIDDLCERNGREVETLRTRSAEVVATVSLLEDELNGLRVQQQNMADERAGILQRLTSLVDRCADLDRELLKKRDYLSGKVSRLESLRELEARFEGYGRGVRSVMLADRFKGRFSGVLADLVETDDAYEAALEAVLGETLYFIIGHDVTDIREAIAFLHETSGGRSSFILDRHEAVAAGPVPAGVEPLLARVVIAGGYEERIRQLLAQVYIVADLGDALAMQRAYPAATFVTLQGEIAAANGIVCGGSFDGAGQGLIHQKREIKKLTTTVSTVTVEVAEQELMREQLLSKRAAEEERLRHLEQELHQGELQRVNAEKDLLRAREERGRIDELLEVKRLEDAQLAEEQTVLVAEKTGLDQSKSRAEERRQVLEREVHSLQGALAEWQMQRGQLAEEVTALKVTVASLKERRDAATRAIMRLEDLAGGIQVRLSGQSAELDGDGDEQQRLITAIQDEESRLNGFLLKHAAAEGALRQARERYEECAAQVNGLEQQQHEVRFQDERLKQTRAEQSLILSETLLQLRHLESSVAEKFRIEFDEISARYGQLSFEKLERQQRLDELTALIRDMGEVNLTAIKEYGELEERFTFLTTQQADLQESSDTLQKAIQRINRTTRKRFQETFEQVNDRFREMFPRLFCGGKGELRLTDEEDLLETGIDIIVQPPGKKLQNVSLLSGGEKALTAVALIFSIFLIKPTPFCLLDEVDAPLDDANIGRFNDIVREISAISQFIIITHNRGTMAVADTLYGVTMEEPGVSKIVSVKLN